MSTVSIDLKRLRANPPRSLGNYPPWLPTRTYAVAQLLGVHPKTLLAWCRDDIGPQPLPQHMFVGNHFYWKPGEIIAWWEKLALPPGKARSYEQICDEWLSGTRQITDDEKWEWPPAHCALDIVRSMMRPEPRCLRELANGAEPHPEAEAA